MGSCGSLDPNIGVGSLVTPLSACAVTSNYDYFTDDDYSDQEPYLISRPVNADPELHSALFENVKNAHGVSDSDAACVGHTVNASADSFYSSQGRTDPSFYDANDTLLESIVDKVPNVSTLEVCLLHNRCF